MKKIFAAALAAAVAAGGFAATTGEAAAKPWHPKYHYSHKHHHRHHGPNFFGGPFFLGLGLGLVAPRYYPAYPAYGARYGNAHVQWCINRYRTYNPATNTYFIRKGVPAVCVSPYSY